MSIANVPQNGKKVMSRIALKIDTWENWQKDSAKSLVLHAGEVAFVQMGTVPPIGTDKPNTGAYDVLFKVGDGTTAFKDLPWGSAKAADVYDWAKTDAANFQKWLKGETVSGLTTITDKFIVESVLNNAVTTLSNSIAAVDRKVDAISIPDVSNFATKTEVTNADNALKQELIGTESGTATTIKGASAQAAEAKTAADNAATAANTANTWINNHKNVKHITETEMNTAISNADNAVKSALIGTGTSSITTIKGAADAAANAQTTASEAKTKVEILIGADAGKSAREIANAELAKQLIPDSAKDALDTLAEIAAWIQDHPEDVATINLAIENLNKQLSGLGTSGTNGSAKKYVDDAITAEQTARNNAITAALNPLDLTQISLSAGETLSFIKQEDGKVTANKQSISITESQISNFGNYQPAGDYVTNTTFNNHVAKAVTEDTYLVLDCGTSTINID